MVKGRCRDGEGTAKGKGSWRRWPVPVAMLKEHCTVLFEVSRLPSQHATWGGRTNLVGRCIAPAYHRAR